MNNTTDDQGKITPTKMDVAQKEKGTANPGLLVLSLVLLAGVGVYIWQHHKVTTMEARITTLTKDIASLESQVADTQKTAQKTATIEINHVSRFALFGASTKDYVAVNVSIKNSSTKAMTINTANFKLRDADNNTYKSYKDVLNGETDNAVIQEALPDGDTLLTNQSLAKGETIKGTLVYSAQNTLSDFSLIFDNQSYQATVK